MTISEAQRFELHAGLRKVMGDEVANTLMEHLPPSGWADVARESDIDRLESRIDTAERRLDNRIDGVVKGLWALGSLMVTCFIGTISMIATKL